MNVQRPISRQKKTIYRHLVNTLVPILKTDYTDSSFHLLAPLAENDNKVSSYSLTYKENYRYCSGRLWNNIRTYAPVVCYFETERIEQFCLPRAPVIVIATSIDAVYRRLLTQRFVVSIDFVINNTFFKLENDGRRRV